MVSSPELAVIELEQSAAIISAVEGLPRRQRECVVLRFFADCSVSATAATLGISDGAVKQHVHRAMIALADVLGDNAEAEL